MILTNQRSEQLEESHCSLTTEILPTPGARTSNRRVKLRNFIITPFSRRYRIWETFLAVLVFYTAWASPFEFGYLKKPEGILAISDNVVNGFFLIDIILTFFLAYLDSATYLLVDEPKQIAWRYAKSWLAFDVISSIPSEAIYKLTPRHIHSYGLFNMLRLWRLRRVGILFCRLEKDINFNYFWVRFTKLVCVTLFSVHCAACFFYFLAADNHHPNRTWIGASNKDIWKESIWVRYATSIYWAMTTITTVGYGDLHPVNVGEMIFASFIMIFNVILFAYLIGNITHLIVHETRRTLQFRDTMEAASSFVQRNQLPVRLQEQILGHLSLKFRTDLEGLQQQETIDSLPRAIQSNISHYLFYSLVDQVYLFRGVSSDLLFQLVSEMKAEYFPPKEDVILQNEAPTSLYILASGSAELVVTRNGVEQVVGELQSGDLCGEISVLCYKPQLFTVRTKRLSQLLRLNRTAFLNIVQANVRDGTIIMNNLLQHLTDVNEPIMEGVFKETEKMLARGGMDLPLSLCFAAARGDDHLLNQLLKRGLDPNESDNNGRTALHIAASKGSENCVRLLLDHGAEPNYKDSDGNVALWEAMLGGHDHVAKLLHENGAVLDAGEVCHFACVAAEQNSMKLLEEIVRHGGDVTAASSSNGETALHIAVSEANIEIVKYLLKQGADIDRPNLHGWTPRALANQQGHDEIKTFFQSEVEDRPKLHTTVSITRERPVPTLSRYRNESTVSPARNQEGLFHGLGGSLGRTRPRRRANSFHSSLFGVMTEKDASFSLDMAKAPRENGNSDDNKSNSCIRVTISCSQKSDSKGKLVILPRRFEDLVNLGLKKLGVLAKKVVNREGFEVEDIEVIRDGDHLIFIGSDDESERLKS